MRSLTFVAEQDPEEGASGNGKDIDVDAIVEKAVQKSREALSQDIDKGVNRAATVLAAKMDGQVNNLRKLLVGTNDQNEYTDSYKVGQVETNVALEREEAVKTPAVEQPFRVFSRIPLKPQTIMYYEWLRSVTKNPKLTLGDFLDLVTERYFKDENGVSLLFAVRKKEEPEMVEQHA